MLLGQNRKSTNMPFFDRDHKYNEWITNMWEMNGMKWTIPKNRKEPKKFSYHVTWWAPISGSYIEEVKLWIKETQKSTYNEMIEIMNMMKWWK